ncbi:MAG: hypothetical protein H6Q20_1938 [Bacteroidetes bacterium]|nr:hypothetical protein [Bacteroidota bacterium]
MANEIMEINGFKVRKSNWGKLLILDYNKINDSLEFMKKHKITGIHINYTANNNRTLEDVYFLEAFDFLEKVEIIFTSVDDFTGIYKLPNLKSLYLGDITKKEIDFTKLPNLEECLFQWRNNVKGFFDLRKLKKLTVFKYSNKTLEGFNRFTTLTELNVFNSFSIASLKGIGGLKISKLNLGLLPKLESLDYIDQLSESLKEIELDTCKKIKSIEIISKLPNLEIFNAYNCGEIDSINSIRTLKKLKGICVGFTVLDGDMSPCIGLKNVTFVNKKHYSHTLNEIRTLNGEPLPYST